MTKAKTRRWDWHSKEGRGALDAAVLAELVACPGARLGRAAIGAAIGIAKDDVHGLRAVWASLGRAMDADGSRVMFMGLGGQRVYWYKAETVAK